MYELHGEVMEPPGHEGMWPRHTHTHTHTYDRYSYTDVREANYKNTSLPVRDVSLDKY